MSEQNGSTTSVTGQIIPPPRFSGDIESQFRQLSNYVWDLFTKLGLTDLFVRFTEAFGGTGFDPTSLPDPATSTIPEAQDTANNAFALAASNLSTLGFDGELTVSEADDEATVTFSAAEDNATYKVFAVPQAFSGTPADGAFTIKKIDKTTGGFTVTFLAAPGAGNSVTYDYWMRR